MTNGYVRKYIENSTKSYISKATFLIDLFSGNDRNDVDAIRKNAIYSVMIGDLYKILNEKFISNTLSVAEENVFVFLNIIDDYDVVIQEVFKSSELQCMLLNSTINFNEFNVFGKIELHKILNDNQINRLKKISPTIDDDIETYNKDFDLKDYMKFYRNYTNHLRSIAPYGCEISFIDAMKNHFTRLFQYDPSINSKVLNELCEYYFKMNSYLESKNVKRYKFLDYKECSENIHKFINDSDNIEKMLLFWISVEESKKDNVYNIDGIEFNEEEYKNYNKEKIYIKK